MDVITKFYKALANEKTAMFVEHSAPYPDVMIIRSLVNELFGLRLEYEEVYLLLWEEGLLPPKEYGIPSWYVQKYFKPAVVWEDGQDSEA